jgi:DNA modification methylase
MIATDPPYGVTEHEWDRPLMQDDLDRFLAWAAGTVFVFGAARTDRMQEILSFTPRPERLFVWRVDHPRSANPEQAFWAWEPIYVWRQRGIKLWDAIEWSSKQDETTGLHPSQKPVGLMEKLIGATDAQTIGEPFSGSGTTLVACERLGRTCFAVERDPGYVDVAVRRWQQMTHQTAILESTGQPFPVVE